jgi:hypothetical protein
LNPRRLPLIELPAQPCKTGGKSPLSTHADERPLKAAAANLYWVWHIKTTMQTSTCM